MRILKFSGSPKYRIDEQFQNSTIFWNLDKFFKFGNFENSSVFLIWKIS